MKHNFDNEMFTTESKVFPATWDSKVSIEQ